MELISALAGWDGTETGCVRARMEMNSAGLDRDGCSFHTHAGLYLVYFSCQHDVTHYRSLGAPAAIDRKPVRGAGAVVGR